jgi:hypothetical protein
MNLAITIHPSWLQRPDALGRRLAAIAALEVVAPTPPEPGDDDQTSRPESPAPARRQPDRGDAWEPPDDDQDQDQDAPTNGRQVLGGAAKQVPDRKGILIGYGQKKGLRSKIVDGTPDQVADAYRFARARPSQPRRSTSGAGDPDRILRDGSALAPAFRGMERPHFAGWFQGGTDRGTRNRVP